MDRNENQNSYRNTRNTRGSSKTIRGLKTRFYIMTGIAAALLVALIIALILLLRPTTTAPKPDDGKETQKETQRVTGTENSEAATEEKTEKIYETTEEVIEAIEKQTEGEAVNDETEPSVAQEKEAATEKSQTDAETQTGSGAEAVNEDQTEAVSDTDAQTEQKLITVQVKLDGDGGSFKLEEKKPSNGSAPVTSSGQEETVDNADMGSGNTEKVVVDTPAEYPEGSELTFTVTVNEGYEITRYTIEPNDLEREISELLDTGSFPSSGFTDTLTLPESEKASEELNEISIYITVDQVRTDPKGNGTSETGDTISEEGLSEEITAALKEDAANLQQFSYRFVKVPDGAGKGHIEVLAQDTFNMDEDQKIESSILSGMFLVGTAYRKLATDTDGSTLGELDSNCPPIVLNHIAEGEENDLYSYEEAWNKLIEWIGGYDVVSAFTEEFGYQDVNINVDGKREITLKDAVDFFADMENPELWKSMTPPPVDKPRDLMTEQLEYYSSDQGTIDHGELYWQIEAGLDDVNKDIVREEEKYRCYWIDDTPADNHSYYVTMFKNQDCWYVFGLFIPSGTLLHKPNTSSETIAKIILRTAGLRTVDSEGEQENNNLGDQQPDASSETQAETQAETQQITELGTVGGGNTGVPVDVKPDGTYTDVDQTGSSTPESGTRGE